MMYFPGSWKSEQIPSSQTNFLLGKHIALLIPSLTMNRSSSIFEQKITHLLSVASPSFSHAFANFTLNLSALLLSSCPFSLRHRSITFRISIPTGFTRAFWGKSHSYVWAWDRPRSLLGRVRKLHWDFLWHVQQQLAGLSQKGPTNSTKS